jgi:hypothetical protein
MKRPRATRSLFRCPQCRPPRAADEPSASGGVSASFLPDRWQESAIDDLNLIKIAA